MLWRHCRRCHKVNAAGVLPARKERIHNVGDLLSRELPKRVRHSAHILVDNGELRSAPTGVVIADYHPGSVS